MIHVKIIADSISAYYGTRITTFELEYHRYIHAEFMTHREFSRNAASSRAIPVARMLELVREEPVVPVHLGKNKSGMQATELVDNPEEVLCVWRELAKTTANFVEKLNELGLHKQVANRPLEAFQRIKTVMTTTNTANWYWLRNHSDAQPEIWKLAELMQEAQDASTPVILYKDQWHMPYVEQEFAWGQQTFKDETGASIALDKAKMISSSCCAQISYRKNDPSLEKAETIFQRLIESKPCHASPTEHQATPVGPYDTLETEGITHMLRNRTLCSGNFRNWIQHRQLIDQNVMKDEA